MIAMHIHAGSFQVSLCHATVVTPRPPSDGMVGIARGNTPLKSILSSLIDCRAPNGCDITLQAHVPGKLCKTLLEEPQVYG